VILKKNTLKIKRILKIFENLNPFEMMLKMLKWRKYIKKHIFWIFVVFLYFWIFLKIYQNMGQKLGSNRCPLFTMFTKQNSSMFCIVSFVKKTCLLVLTCWVLHSSKDLTFFFFFYFFLFSFSPFSLFFLSSFSVNLRSHLATSFNQNQRMCVARSIWNPIWRFPSTKATWDPI